MLNSTFIGNRATGRGANPVHRPGQPGGGSGGAIYTDGNDYTLRVAGTLMRDNHANEGGGGGAIFYVSNDRSGTLHLRWSTLRDNISENFETRPGIFYEGLPGPIDVQRTRSSAEPVVPRRSRWSGWRAKIRQPPGRPGTTRRTNSL